MAWNDDSWRDSYDSWKLRSPYDEYDHEECHHHDYEIDMAGIAHCETCGERWTATRAEIAAQRENLLEYDRWTRRQERREFWRKLTYPIRWPIFRLLDRVWPRQATRVLDDSEVPF